MSYVLHYPQRPLVKTRFNDYVHGCHLPNGENLIVAVCTYTGYNQEDSIIVNKRAIEKGMFNLTYFKCYEDEEEVNAETGEKVMFANRNKLIGAGVDMKTKACVYEHIDEHGLPLTGTLIKEGYAIIGKAATKHIATNGDSILTATQEVEHVDKTVVADKTVEGVIDKIVMFKDDDGMKHLKMRIRKIRFPEFGDKMASRHGQKGVIGMILPHEDMPFTQDGIVPDIIINPHAFPSRMTVGHMMECIIGKMCCMEGMEYDGIAFETHDFEKMYDCLETKYKMHRHGDEIMYDGLRGQQIATQVFFGPTHYYRLKHMVADKLNYRTSGKIVNTTKQPTQGRGNDGGLRIGEMETNVLVSHGMSSFIKESFMERSDKYNFFIDPATGDIASDNPHHVRVMAPYSMKLLTQELQTMGIMPRYEFERREEEDEDEYEGNDEDEDISESDNDQ